MTTGVLPAAAPTRIAPPTRIAVVGSCITQQALHVFGMPKDQLAASHARTSLAGLTPPSASCPVIDPAILNGLKLPATVRHWLAAELTKSIPATLVQARPEIVIFDFIEERFDLLQLESGLVLNESRDFVDSGLAGLPVLAGARRIPRLSEEAWSLWEAGLLRLGQWIRQSPLAHCPIMLHRAFWTSAMQGPAGREPLPDPTMIMPERAAFRAGHNGLLNRCYDRFLQEFPEALVVEAPPETCIADPNHPWGLAPYHYVPAYYQAIADQWRRMGLVPHRSQPATDEPGRMAQKARSELLEAAKAHLAGTVQAGQDNIHDEWRRFLIRIATHIVNDDLDSFTSWGTIVDTMFVTEYGDTARQLNALFARPDWQERWRPALVESPTGKAGRSRLYPPSSANQIRQAYVLARFEDEMRARIDSFDQIIEFGAGFGALCLLVHRLGFKGRYVLVDNQPIRALQRWYLGENGLDLASDGELPDSGICSVANTALQEVLQDRETRRTAFLANWSLSETTPPFRDKILATLKQAQVDALWVTYQHLFGVDNMKYFASRLQDFLNVYEATIRPFQPDAAPSDYHYGHACLALRRIPGRGFPAIITTLEKAPFETRDMRHLTMDELHDRLRKAITEGTPFSAIRLGDGEGRIIGFPEYVPRRLVADIWQTWFGQPGFPDEQVACIRHALKDACLNADVVGVPKAEADIHCDFGRVQALLPREGFVHSATPLCHAGFHLGFNRENRYPKLFDGLPRLGVIGPRDLTAILPKLYGIAQVIWLPVPPEMKFSDLPAREKAAVIRANPHLTTRYREMIDRDIPRVLERHPGLVVLVGAGILGKIYCRRVKELGGIAIDVGSMMDAWAGLKTRDNQNFAGLRLVVG